MTFIPSIPALILLLAFGGANLKAQTLLNGSFELGTDPNTGVGLNIGMTALDSVTIPGWTVAIGTVDYIGARWAAGDGVRSLDLSGVSAGSIQQSVQGFTPGVTYEVSFLMAGNPEGGYPTKGMEVSIGGTSGTFLYTVSGTANEMMWVSRRFEFIAHEPTLTLAFTSLNNDASGAALDGVQINSVPEPSILALVIAGTAAFGYRRWKSEQSGTE